MKALSRLALIPAFALLMALCAQVAIPMVPVPMTLQTFAVLLAGAVLGGGRGAAAVLLYLAMAAAGLPVLAESGSGLERFAGPTAGYLFAFPFAALVAGQPGRRRLFRTPGAETALMIGAHLLILAVGAGWLATSLGLRDALAHGFTPFLIGAAVKSVAVVACATVLRRLALFRP